MSELCDYDGPDTTAVVTDTYDRGEPAAWVPGTYYSRCHCGKVTCESGTYDEALEALEDHRAESRSDDGE
jgi:hypothetical protein